VQGEHPRRGGVGMIVKIVVLVLGVIHIQPAKGAK